MWFRRVGAPGLGRAALVLTVCAGTSGHAVAQPFADINAGLTGVFDCSASWGDYDNDGDLDLALAGRDEGGAYLSRIYRNDGNDVFTDLGVPLLGVNYCSLSWGDYDNDGDLDLAIAGREASGTRVSRIYRSDGNDVFTDIGAALEGVTYCSLSWGDYDNDGDLDLAVAGQSCSGRVSRIYRNDGNDHFTDVCAALTGASWCSLSWGDYDNDGDLDLAILGLTYGNQDRESKIYRNDGNDVFTDIDADLTGVSGGSLSWGDYDNDGDLDLAISGSYYTSGPGTPVHYVSKIYRNDGGGIFTDVEADLTQLGGSSLSWGDYDNDGDLDLAIAGEPGWGQYVSQIYRNEGGGVFADIGAALTGVNRGSLSWGDYDGDGDLDLVLAGEPDFACCVSRVYRNDGGVFNTAPSSPGGLSGNVAGNDLTFSWDAASDNETPTDGLSYNLRVGTAPGADDVFSGMADPSSGFRRLVATGNAQKRRSWTLYDLPGGTYYWSVQAVDTAFAGSLWAAEQSAKVWFTDIDAALMDVMLSSLAWGDYDNDGDLDLAIAGRNAIDVRLASVYRNDGGGMFSDIGPVVMGVSSCSLAWGDYDNDGDLDLAIAGREISGDRMTRIYRNDGSDVFADIGASLAGVYYCSLAWGDYDNDGDLDLAVAGRGDFNTTLSKIYRNEGDGGFTDIGAGLTPMRLCSLAWGDYDNDGDLDLALAGRDEGGAYASKIYRNEGAGVFTDIQAGLAGVYLCSLAWGDYDNDSDLDLAIAGHDYSTPVSKIYRNDVGGVFTDIDAGLRGMAYCSLAWGDYDNDGDLDLAIAGYDYSKPVSKIYRNDGAGVFTDVRASLTGVEMCSLAWGDYDNDGDLDLGLAGEATTGIVSRIYRNDGGVFNTAPAAPEGGLAWVRGSCVTFNWDAASDNQTPSGGLSYNLRVGLAPGTDDVFCGHADLSSGLRRIPGTGNAQKTLSWALKGLPDGTYYWSVQAIDTALAGSPWAGEQSVSLPTPFAPADFDQDCDVDADDLAHFVACATGPALGPPASGCGNADLDDDNDVDQSDFGLFQRCLSGPGVPADPRCADGF